MDQATGRQSAVSVMAGFFCAWLLAFPTHLQCAGAEDEAEKDTTNEARTPAGFLVVDGIVVDDKGDPVPNIRVRLHSLSDSVPSALSDREGRFRFRLDVATTRFITFEAHNLKDGKRGYLQIAEEGTLRLPAPLKLVLKPPRELAIEVRGPNGEPIADAQVAASDLLHARFEGRSGVDGKVLLRIPVDVSVHTVIALKSGRGFDSWIDRLHPAGPTREVPDRIELTLKGARRVRVHAIDSAGRGVPDISVIPWTITKKGESFYANLSGFGDRLDDTKTNAEGIATIDWLPAEFDGAIAFLANAKGYHLPKTPRYEETDVGDVVELSMPLLRMTSISGRVLDAEGRPAPGIILQAEGRGESNLYFRGFARTNTEGEFEFQAYPEQAYLVAVLDENCGAPSQPLPVLVEDQPIRNVELRLGKGTLVCGTVTGEDGKPLAKETVTLFQTATPPVPAQKVDLVRWAHSDGNGRYRFRIGPGDYTLIAPNHAQQIQLKIDEQSEVIHDFQVNPVKKP